MDKKMTSETYIPHWYVITFEFDSKKLKSFIRSKKEKEC